VFVDELVDDFLEDLEGAVDEVHRLCVLLFEVLGVGVLFVVEGGLLVH
jgi:hypothetical protein